VADPAEKQKADIQENADSLDKQMLEKSDKNDDQSNKEFEMSSLKVRTV